jgi:hypothetical protein
MKFMIVLVLSLIQNQNESYDNVNETHTDTTPAKRAASKDLTTRSTSLEEHRRHLLHYKVKGIHSHIKEMKKEAWLLREPQDPNFVDADVSLDIKK